jgi:hypothetical protein
VQAGKLVALRSSRARPPTKNADRIVDYFPISAVLERGFIEPREVSHLGSMNAWPRVSFHTADWVTIADPGMLGPYDTILALSVSIIQTLHSSQRLIRPGHQVDTSGTSRPRFGGFLQEVLLVIVPGWVSHHRVADMGIIRESRAAQQGSTLQ